MKIKLHILVTDEENNIAITLAHTGVHSPTRCIPHDVEIEIPDPPQGFAVQRILIVKEPA